MNGNVTQKRFLLEHLQKYGSIEPLTALKHYGIYRLGARISDLRAEGWNIKTDRITTKSLITGHPVTFAKYILDPNA